MGLVLADSAYASGEALDAFAAAGYDTAIKPIDPKPRIPGGFTRDDFTIDTDAQTVTCPAGHTKAVTSAAARFGALCRGCLWVPIIRSWALTRGFALHPGTRNRYKIRYTRTQHRAASRQVNDHGRVSGTHRASTSLVRRVSGSVRVVGILVSDGLVPPGVLIVPRRAGVCQAFQILAVCYHGCAWYRGGALCYAMWAAQAAMTGRRASSRSARW